MTMETEASERRLGRNILLAWLAGLIVSAAFVCMMLPALGHDAPSGWSYPYECCSGHDCAEIASSRVKPVASGYLVDGKHLVEQKDVKDSPDGAFHACFPSPEVLRCFWAPPRGV